MNSHPAHRARWTCVVVSAFVLSACAQTPMGPTVQVMPGPGKTLDAFQADQATCRQFAEQAVAGQAQNANVRGVGAAALTTALGAGLGAAIGGGRGAGIGAASGALGGGALGAATSANAQGSIQDQYNNAFAQCMFTQGNTVPGMGPTMTQQPAASTVANTSLTRPVQSELIRLGYMRGPADGTLGPQTSSAISRFQSSVGMAPDGMPSTALLTRLQATQ